MSMPTPPPTREDDPAPSVAVNEAVLPTGRRSSYVNAVVYIGREIVPRILTLWLISVIVFASTQVLGIDVALSAMGREVTPEQLSAFRELHGLDEPLLVQYGSWLWDFVRGDWGYSVVTGRPVQDGVMPRLINTLTLAVIALLVTVPISVGFGVYMAKLKSKRASLALSIGTIQIAATPVYVLGILFIYLFSVTLHWTPVDSGGLAFGDFADRAAAYVLPVSVLVISILPHVGRLTQVSFRETMATPYARAAVLRGLSRRTITWRNLMPNAAAPIVNVIALEMIWMVGGVIVVENVFGFPGLGSLLVQSIGTGDMITVQAIAMLTGAIFIGISLAADLLVIFFNPRLRG